MCENNTGANSLIVTMNGKHYRCLVGQLGFVHMWAVYVSSMAALRHTLHSMR